MWRSVSKKLAAGTLHIGLVHNPFAQAYVDAGTLTLDRALGLNNNERGNLNAAGVRALLDAGTITLDAALNLTYDQVTALSDAAIRARVTAGTLHIGLVHNPFTQAYVNAGTLTLDEALNLTYDQVTALSEAVVPNINDSQSTHNASVHQSVSESATRLPNRYQLMNDGADIESDISEIAPFAAQF